MTIHERALKAEEDAFADNLYSTSTESSVRAYLRAFLKDPELVKKLLTDVSPFHSDAAKVSAALQTIMKEAGL